MDGTSIGTGYSQYTLRYWFIGFGEYNLRISQKSVKECDLALSLCVPNNWDGCFSKKCPENTNLFLNLRKQMIPILQLLNY
jgi:hypothetical protein